MSRRSGHASGSLAKRPCGSFSPVAVTRYSPSGPSSGPARRGARARRRRPSIETGVSGGTRLARAARAAAAVVGHLGPAERAAHDRPGAAGQVIRGGERGVAAVGREPQQRLGELDLVGGPRQRRAPARRARPGATQPPAWVGSASSGAAWPRSGAGARLRRCARSPSRARSWRRRAGEPRGRDVQDAARVVVPVSSPQRRGEGLRAAPGTADRSGAGARP